MEATIDIYEGTYGYGKKHVFEIYDYVFRISIKYGKYKINLRFYETSVKINAKKVEGK